VVGKKSAQYQCWLCEITFKDETGERFIIGSISEEQEWKLIYMTLATLYGWQPHIVTKRRWQIPRPEGAPKGAFVMHQGRVLSLERRIRHERL